MTQGKRAEVSAAQRTDIWRRWKAGQSLHEIGRAFGRTHTSIHLLLSHHGGIVPAVRRRSARALTLAEREDISRGIASGSSMREIATRLCRATSTVSREITRHGGRSVYRASEADSQAWESARRPKLCLLAIHEPLREIVVSKLILDWSPEQVSGWLKSQYPKDESLRVSHYYSRAAVSFKCGPRLLAAVGAYRQDCGVQELSPGALLGHYKLVRRLGQGGMGVVWEARDQKLGRHVAVKLLIETTRNDSSALERFWREARAASSLNHPGICTIYELDESAETPFIVM